MVRLRAALRLAKSTRVSFQFQYGAIERVQLDAENQGETEFQFQYGAIESCKKLKD